MVKNILAVLAGLLVGFIVLTGLEGYSAKLYPQPEHLDMKNREAMATYIAGMPMSAVMVEVFAYALSSLIGGYIASRISKNIRQSFVVGCILFAAGVFNVVMIPHPIWMAALFLVTFIPCALLGGKLAVASRNAKS